MELLPKSYSDFRLSFYEDEVSKIQEAYIEYEEQRKSKLATARRLRARMKGIERGLLWQPDPASSSSSFRPRTPVEARLTLERDYADQPTRIVSKERTGSRERYLAVSWSQTT